MARNVAILHTRGVLANMPALSDGEFYVATDTGQLYVGFAGDALPVGGPFTVQIADPVTPSQIVRVQTDGSIQVSIGTAAGKTTQLKTGSLTTTAVTAGQTILTYTVTALKTLFLEYIDIQARLTAVAATASILGSVTVSIAGVGVYTATFVNPTTSDSGGQSVRLFFSEPIPIAAGSVVLIAVTPAATTSMLWIGNFGGYEK